MKKISLVIIFLFAASMLKAQNLDLYLDGFGPMDCALRSAVLPGWGQIHRGSKTKGYFIMGIEGIGIASSYYFYRKAQKKYDQYKHEGIRDSGLYDDYKKNIDNSRIAAASSAAVWLYAIVEAYFGAEKISQISFNADADRVDIRITKRF